MRRRIRHSATLLALLALLAAPLAVLAQGCCASGQPMARHCCCGGAGGGGCPVPGRPCEPLGMAACPAAGEVEHAAPLGPAPEPAPCGSVLSPQDSGAPTPLRRGDREPRLPAPRFAASTSAFQTVLPPPARRA